MTDPTTANSDEFIIGYHVDVMEFGIITAIDADADMQNVAACFEQIELVGIGCQWRHVIEKWSAQRVFDDVLHLAFFGPRTHRAVAIDQISLPKDGKNTDFSLAR